MATTQRGERIVVGSLLLHASEPSEFSIIEIHSRLALGFEFRMAMAMACTGAWGRILEVQGYKGLSLARADASGVKHPVTGTSTPEGDFLLERVKSKTAASPKSPAAAAIYTPTPSKRDTRTPHSGYHFDGTSRRFFEGWYFKVSIPEAKQSFAWMYSVEDPGTALNTNTNSTLPLENLFQGSTFPGVGAQIMGADDKYLWQFDENLEPFWGSRHELALGHTFTSKGRVSPPKGEVYPKVIVMQPPNPNL